MILLTPVVFIVNKITEGVLVILHVNPDEKANAMTEHELRTLVNVGEKDGVIENEENRRSTMCLILAIQLQKMS